VLGPVSLPLCPFFFDSFFPFFFHPIHPIHYLIIHSFIQPPQEESTPILLPFFPETDKKSKPKVPPL
jgi:hypothetical protein